MSPCDRTPFPHPLLEFTDNTSDNLFCQSGYPRLEPGYYRGPSCP
jgi:hypothetical protein